MTHIKKYEIYYWVYVILFLILAIPLHFYWPFVAPIRYTKELPVQIPSALTTDIWSWGHIREGLYAFIYIIILSGLFMISSKTSMGRNIHFIVLFLFAFLFLINFGLDISAIKTGQVAPDSTTFTEYNPARSIDYCALHGLNPLASRVCSNINLWSITALNTNPNFLFRFVCNILLFVFVLFDAIFTLSWCNIVNKK